MAKQPKSDPFLETFKEAVPKAYASIINDFNFSVSFDPKWEESFTLSSDVCFIFIYLDRDNSISSDIKPARKEQVPKVQYYNTISLAQLINFLDPEAKFKYGVCPTPEKLREEIERFATLTRQYCTPMMEGDFSKWIELRKIIMEKAGVPF